LLTVGLADPSVSTIEAPQSVRWVVQLIGGVGGVQRDDDRADLPGRELVSMNSGQFCMYRATRSPGSTPAARSTCPRAFARWPIRPSCVPGPRTRTRSDRRSRPRPGRAGRRRSRSTDCVCRTSEVRLGHHLDLVGDEEAADQVLPAGLLPSGMSNPPIQTLSCFRYPLRGPPCRPPSGRWTRDELVRIDADVSR